MIIVECHQCGTTHPQKYSVRNSSMQKSVFVCCPNCLIQLILDKKWTQYFIKIKGVSKSEEEQLVLDIIVEINKQKRKK